MNLGGNIEALLFHPVELISGTYNWNKPDNAALVDVNGSGPTALASVLAVKNDQGWGSWISGKLTGVGETAGSFTGNTLASTIKPLLPILIILLVVLIVTKVIADKAVSSI